MTAIEQETAESLLLQLNRREILFPECEFVLEKHKLKLLGKGGFAKIYEMVSREDSEKHYALKVIGMERHKIASEQFQQIISLQKKLSEECPYICQIFDSKELLLQVDEANPQEILCVSEKKENPQESDALLLQFVLMEKLEGIISKSDAGVVLARKELEKEAEIMRFAQHIGSAIQCAHNHKILHRDIKLENVFWDKNKHCYKLGDFGISKYVEEESANTRLFTLGYGAPEVEGAFYEQFDQTIDIYSFGISLYLLCNQLKFPGSNGYYVNQNQYTPNFSIPALDNRKLTVWIQKMCAFNRADRYQYIEDVFKEYETIISAQDVSKEIHQLAEEIGTVTFQDADEEVLEKSPYFLQINRMQRIRKEKEDKALLHFLKRGFGIAFVVVWFILFRSVEDKVDTVRNWQFWVFPLAMVIQSTFRYYEIYDKIFGYITMFIGLISLYYCDFSFFHIMLLFAFLMGESIISNSACTALVFWSMILYTNKLNWMYWIYRYPFAPIFLFLLLELIWLYNWMLLMFREPNEKDWIKGTIYITVPAGLIVFSVGYELLKKIGLFSAVFIVEKLHCFWVGIIFLIVNILIVNWYIKKSEVVDKE